MPTEPTIKLSSQLLVALEDGDVILRPTSSGVIRGQVNHDQGQVHWDAFDPGTLSDDEEEARFFSRFIYDQFREHMRSKHKGGFVLIYRKFGYDSVLDEDTDEKLWKMNQLRE